jgi:hypothetical protein
MIRRTVLLVSLFVMVLVVLCPVQAFTAKSLTIEVRDNSDATVTFDYDLSWIGSRPQFYVQGFASGEVRNGTGTLTTPVLSFREAEKILKQYWFASLVNPDFSPDVTRVLFPDGYVQTFNNQDQIPQVSHSLRR